MNKSSFNFKFNRVNDLINKLKNKSNLISKLKFNIENF